MRPTKDEIFMRMAQLVAERGTCARRKVGCVLVNSLGHVLSTGYNGVARGLKHCTDFPCTGVNAPSGEKLDTCEAIHAEQNALLQCRDVQEIEVCYTTVSPCLHCIKLLMNTGCKQIAFLEEYVGAEKSRDLWLSSRKETLHYSPWLNFGPKPIQFEVLGIGPKIPHPRKFDNLKW